MDNRPDGRTRGKKSSRKAGKRGSSRKLLEQMKEMNDGATGKDDVTIGMIRNCYPETQIVMAEKIKQMAWKKS